MFDTPGIKTVILFVFLYSATRDIQLATILTFGVVGLNYAMSQSDMCYALEDKNAQDFLGNGFWTGEPNKK